MMGLNEQAARRVNLRSPPAEEGFAVERLKLDLVKGSLATIAFSRQPLTRPRSARAPSPTRGEGEYRTHGGPS
jgi:hypothetical protein